MYEPTNPLLPWNTNSILRVYKIKSYKTNHNSKGSDPLAQARDSRSSENLTVPTGFLSLKRGILAQARISLCQQPQFAISRPGEATLAQARIFQYSPGFHPPRKNLMTSHVKGKDIVLDTKTFSSICCDIPIISKEEIEQRKQQGYGETVKKIDILSVGVSLDGDTKVALNLRESKIDIEVVHKMGFSLDPVTRRTYRHLVDRPTTPTDQPEPTPPNQPEVQAHSSSSAAMSSNQMIMDELVSLRGYITTRMDAIDTQNQQIHYELHRLLSRQRSMDIDEDSSEPES
ncbi:hypothetical protein Lal_00032028 [Lupinus albus]|nr:hypothetical protein Lal_00032028 [Lupinus albus]